MVILHGSTTYGHRHGRTDDPVRSHCLRSVLVELEISNRRMRLGIRDPYNSACSAFGIRRVLFSMATCEEFPVRFPAFLSSDGI